MNGPQPQQELSTAPLQGRGDDLEVCVCPVSGKEYPKKPGVPCCSIESPGHLGVRLIAKLKASRSQPEKPSITEEAIWRAAKDARAYAECVVSRVQKGIITVDDALKELNEEAKLCGWTSTQKRYVKDRLEGKVPAAPTIPFEAEASSRFAERDVATLLKELPRAEAQNLIRSLDDPHEVEEALRGLGKGHDTDEVRQWLAFAPGMTEAILREYADDPDATNRYVALRECAERFPQADLSGWFDDEFPFIAEKAREFQPQRQAPEVAEVPLPGAVAPAPLAVSEPLEAKKRKKVKLPGTSPIEFPEKPEFEGESKSARLGSYGAHSELLLTYDTPNEQYIMYATDYGPIAPIGSQEKDIRQQLQAFGVSSTEISRALKDAKNSIVLIKVASRQVASQDLDTLIKGAVQTAINQWSPEAPRATLMMTAMDELAKITSSEAAREYQDRIKEALNQELEQWPRPEIPGTHQEFTQIARSTPVARTYTPQEKKERVKDLSKHGIPLVEEVAKPVPSEIPPGRRLSAETRNGFTVGDKVRDQSLSELTGAVIGFEGDAIRVAMDRSVYCPAGGIGLYSPIGLLNLGPG